MNICVASFKMHEDYALVVAAENLVYGLEKCGANVGYYLLRQKGYSNLNWEKADLLLFDDAKDELSKYDATILILPCPHNSKAGRREDRWREVYGADTDFFCRIRDSRWNSDRSYGYPHYIDVADRIEYNVAVSKPAFEAMRNYPAPCACIPVAMKIQDDIPPQESRRRQICSFNSFTSTSNNEIAIRAAPKIDGVTVIVTGIGIQWHYMQGEKRRKKYRENGEWIWDRAISSGNLKCLGYDHTDSSKLGVREKHWVPEEEKIQTYLQSRMSFVLEQKNPGLLYVSLIEGLMYGAVPVVMPETIENSPITEEMCIVMENSFDETVNRYIDDTETLQEKMELGFDFAKRTFGAENVAGEWLRLINGSDPRKVGLGLFHQGGHPKHRQVELGDFG